MKKRTCYRWHLETFNEKKNRWEESSYYPEILRSVRPEVPEKDGKQVALRHIEDNLSQGIKSRLIDLKTGELVAA